MLADLPFNFRRCLGGSGFLQDVWRKILKLDSTSFTERAGPLDGVFKLAYISRPSVTDKALHCFHIDILLLGAGLRSIFLKEVIHQERDILQAFPERRELDRNDCQPVIEILAKSAGFGF